VRFDAQAASAGQTSNRSARFDVTDKAGRAAQRVAGRVAGRVAQRAANFDFEPLATSMLATIDRAAESRWDAAVARAASLPGQIRPEKIASLTDGVARELAAVGAASGAAAAAPAVGTAASLLAVTADLAWFTTRAGDLILTIAALHGRAAPTVDERRAWVLAVLIYGSSARDGFNSAANQLGLRLEGSSTKLPIASLRAINGLLARMLVRRYGSRRGAVAVLSRIPLGVGAVVGGAANYSSVRALARHADEFFSRLPYSAIEVTAR
jgi:EcsC protein family